MSFNPAKLFVKHPGFRKDLIILALTLLTSHIGLAQAHSDWHDPSKHRVQFVTVEEGVRLEVLDWGGSGRPVALLAGLGFTAHVFDGFAETLATSYDVCGITRRGYGASSRPASNYTEERLTEDDLRVFDAPQLAAPVIIGHSVAGNELSQLGIHHSDRIAGLVYLDALNDASDDWTEFDALADKLPDAIKKPPSPSASDLKSFAAFQAWRKLNHGVEYSEAELRIDFVVNPDGSVGDRVTPGYAPEAIMSGGGKHDYSQIRVPVLAFVGYPPMPQNQIKDHHITDPAEQTIVAAVFGWNVGMIRNRIKRINSAAGGARVVELWDANHFVFLSNEAEVLKEIRTFMSELHESANNPGDEEKCLANALLVRQNYTIDPIEAPSTPLLPSVAAVRRPPMKTLTCKELGGTCDQKLSANSWDEMVQKMTKHVMDKHPDVAKEMEKVHHEDPKKWGREMKPKFDNAQEHQSATN